MPRVFGRFVTRNGQPLKTSAGTIIPVSRSLVVRTDASGPVHGGLIWNRPIGFVIQSEDGQRSFASLVDVTRLVQIAILLTSFLGVFLIRRLYRPQK